QGRIPRDLLSQPGPRKDPVALHRLERHPQYRGSLLEGQTGEEALLDHASCALVRRHQALEGLVEGNELLTGLVREERAFVECDRPLPAAPLDPVATPRVIDERGAWPAPRWRRNASDRRVPAARAGSV